MAISTNSNRFPVTAAQARALTVLNCSAPGQTNHRLLVNFETAPDVPALEQAFRKLIDGWEILRTRFVQDRGMDFQQVEDDCLFHIHDHTAKATSLSAIAQVPDIAFDPSRLPLVHAAVFRCDDSRFVLRTAICPVISDAFALGLLLDKVLQIYQAEISTPEVLQYADYAHWQQETAADPSVKKTAAGWYAQLSDWTAVNLPVSELSLEGSDSKKAHRLTVNAFLIERVDRFCNDYNLDQESFLLSCVFVLLYRFSGETDQVVTISGHGRTEAAFRTAPGPYRTEVPLRKLLESGLPFASFCRSVQDGCRLIHKYGDLLPAAGSAAGALPKRFGTYGFGFAGEEPDSAFVWRMTMNGMIDTLPVLTGDHRLSFEFLRLEDRLEGQLRYNPAEVDSCTVGELARSLAAIIEQVTEEPGIGIGMITAVSPEQQHRLLYDYNDTVRDYDLSRPIHAIFEQQVLLYPEKPAVMDGNIALSYRQLNGTANKIAHLLAAEGIQPGSFVGVHLTRTCFLPAVLMGIFKAGGVYVPLDSQLPPIRVREMVDSSGMPFLLTSRELADRASGLLTGGRSLRTIFAEEWIKGDTCNATADPSLPIGGDAPAYMLYTSGSTGKPKGTILHHAGAVNHILAEYEALALDANMVFLQSANISSDISVWQLLAPVLTGGTVVIIQEQELLDYENLLFILQQRAVTIAEFVPSFLFGLVEYLEERTACKLPALRWMMMVGEEVPTDLVNRWLKLFPECGVVNAYGPAEASDDISQFITLHPLPAQMKKVPIGKPLANLNLFILDPAGRLLPPGAKGEIGVSGHGVGYGYWNEPEKTKAVFVDNPFSGTQGCTIYRTGDLGRWLPDGQLEFWGRKDHQVKIRGFRVEPGEIESELRGHAGVNEAFVLVRRSPEGEKYLSAFVVPSRETAGTVLQKLILKKQDPLLYQQLYHLPNGISIVQKNRRETEFSYNEIFTDHIYCRHGITIDPGAVVIDAGANIGLFSLYAGMSADNVTVYAFEPLAPIHRLLAATISLYPSMSIYTFRQGLSSAEKEVTFTYYPYNSMLSGCYGELSEDRDVVEKALRIQLEKDGDRITADTLEELLKDRMQAERHLCSLTTVSALIRREKIDHVDLLKIDVEKSEMDVLSGIEEQDWSKIRQLVVEVHDLDNRLSAVCTLLSGHGYQVRIEEEKTLKATGLYNVYAFREVVQQPIRPPRRTPVPEGWTDREKLLDALRAYCRERLPGYMVPSAFRLLEKLPINLSGKVDRSKLEAIADTPEEDERTIILPITETEKKVSAIWEKVIRQSPISITDDFFDLGGHSLKATQVIAYLHKELQVRVDLRDIFRAPTIAGLAAIIDAREQTAYQSIMPVLPAAEYELSHAQKRLWVLHELEEGMAAYNIHNAYFLDGRLDIDAFRKAFAALIERHESLRTTFFLKAGTPMQRIDLLSEQMQPLFDDLSGNPEADELARRYARQEMDHVFDLETGPLLRLRLIRVQPEKYIFLLTLHHIIADGWSMDVLVKDILQLYEAFVAGKPNPLVPLSLQYKDFAAWQSHRLLDRSFDRHREYWHRKLEGPLPVLDLPSDFPRPAIRTYTGDTVFLQLDAPATEQLNAFAREHNATLFMTILAIVKAILYRYTGQQDIIIGTPVAGRDHTGLEDQIGFYINTLVIRTDVKGQGTLLQLLQDVKENLLGAMEHQSYPFDRLVEDLRLPRDMSRSVLFDVMVMLQNTAIDNTGNNDPEGLGIGYYATGQLASQFDMSIEFEERGNILAGNIRYNPDIYSRDRMQRLAGYIRNLLLEAGKQRNRLLDDLDYLPVVEARELYSFSTGSARPDERITADSETREAALPSDPLLHRLFEAQVQKTPAASALRGPGYELSYHSLNSAADNRAARLRREFSCGRGNAVAVLTDGSAEFVISVLAILKAGGAFVPIDKATPKERIHLLLTESHASCLLADEKEAALHAEYAGCGFLYASIIDDEQCSAGTVQALHDNEPDDLAYILFTSGSTGTPKGVGVTHRNIVHYLLWANDYYFGQAQGYDFGLFTSVSFDLTLTSLFSPLLRGDALHVFPGMETEDVLQHIFFAENSIRAVKLTPSHIRLLSYLPGAPTAVKCVIAGGEELKADDVGLLLGLNPDMEIYNEYGPTETTVGCSVKRIEAGWDTRSIGRPIARTMISILDRNKKPVPVGVPGEIYIGGAGVATGYINHPDLTAAKFLGAVPDMQMKVYRSGDLACWTSEGEIAYLGRIDDQVKIRGHRVSPGEITSVIVDHPGVLEGAVLAVTGNNGKLELAAWYAAEGSVTAMQLEEFARRRLPAYMLPVSYTRVDRLPLTANGKLDRKTLLSTTTNASRRNLFVAPSGIMEEKLASVFSGILQDGPVGRDDNFFEAGGHSLMAVQAGAQILRDTGIRASLKSFFLYPTVRTLAAFLEEQQRTLLPPVKPAPASDHYPLSQAQYRLWGTTQTEGGQAVYNMPAAYILTGPLQITALESALAYIYERHEILRAAFILVDEAPRQKFYTPEQRPLILQREEHLAVTPSGLTEWVAKEAAREFRLDKDVLIRATLAPIGPDQHLFLLTLHHLISDGWSTAVLIDELITAYNAYAKGEHPGLPDLSLQYKDYAGWQQERLTDEMLESKRRFWLEQAEGWPVLSLPIDFQRPARKTFNGSRVQCYLGQPLREEIAGACQRNQVSLFVLLLAAVRVILYRYTGQEDIVIGTPVAEREHPDLEKQLGLYLNTWALRQTIRPEDNFSGILGQCKSHYLQVLEHGDYPFERLVKDLGLTPDLSRAGLFDVMLVLQPGLSGLQQQLDGLSVDAMKMDPAVCNYDLVFNFEERKDGILFALEYNSDLFTRRHAARIARHFHRLLATLVRNETQAAATACFLQEQETGRLINGYSNTLKNWPSYRAVTDCIEEQVLLQPEAIAVVHEEHILTYARLNERANRLAHYLRTEWSVDNTTLVGLMMDRSTDLVVSILGILKAGAAYVPIDPAYPEDRIRFILSDARPRLVLTDRSDPGLEIPDGTAFLSPHLAEDRISRYPSHNPGRTFELTDLAYIIYTSGSTGLPKGVMVEHRNILQLLVSEDHPFDFGRTDVWTLFHSVNFDFSVWELFGCLVHGGRLIVVPKGMTREPAQLARLLVSEQVTILNQVPSMFSWLMEELLNNPPIDGLALRYVIFGGETVQPALLENWCRTFPASKLVNGYGITETTVLTTFKKIGPPEIKAGWSNIGQPFPVQRVYIVDDAGNLVPEGVVGELIVGGAGVARGYLNRDELTAQRFIDDPFNKDGRAYRSGDLGRRLSSGDIVYAGRKDQQVKIRGFRIEPGEIEHALCRCSGIKEAVVIADDVKGHPVLVAFLVQTAQQPDIEVLKAELAQMLPDYMRPSRYCMLPSFPLNSSGKADRKKLLLSETSGGISEHAANARQSAQAPRNRVEELLVDAFSQILDKQAIGIDDHFFELGGDSIMAIQIASKMYQAGYKITVADIFNNPTIRQLSGLTLQTEEVIDQSTLTGAVPLGPVQSAFLDRFTNHDHHFNQSILLRWKDRADPAMLTTVLGALQRHHDMLRAVFVKTSGGWEQQVLNADIPVSCSVLDLRNEQSPIPALERQCAALQEDLDISRGPLMKALLVQLPDADRLFIVIHHLVVDGVSWRILLEDLNTLCGQYRLGLELQLPLKTASFRAWVAFLTAYRNGGAFVSSATFWEGIDHTSTPLPFPQLSSADNRRSDTAVLSFTLGKEETAALRGPIHSVYGTEINDVLLAALAAALRDTYGLEHLRIDMEGHGRETLTGAPSVNRTIGWFTSIYPVVIDIRNQNGIEALIITARDTLGKIPGKGLGYGILHHLPADAAHPPPAAAPLSRASQISFNYLGELSTTTYEGTFTLAEEPSGSEQSPAGQRPYLIDVSGLVLGEQLTLSIAYNKVHFRLNDMETLLEKYAGMVGNMVRHCLFPADGTKPEPLSATPLPGNLTVSQLENFFE